MLFFKEFSCPTWVETEFRTTIFFSLLGYLVPFWLKIMRERGFFNFFRNFFARVEYERNSGLKNFSPFLILFQTFLDRNSAGIKFFNFLIFFAIFFGIFLPGSSMNGIRDYNFFFLFLGQSHLVLSRKNARNRFFNFLNFFAFFFRNFLAWVE